MPEWALSTPVALFVYNRPDTTRRVFDAIRSAQPSKLFVIADGPRDDRPEDSRNCEAVRAIVEGVDWQCEILTNYADTNLGCRDRVSSGLDWVFSEVDEAIVLEDDCLPDATFFDFCAEVLALYRNDSRVMAVSGNNFQLGQKRTQYSYYFSRYNHNWGWATWRRAWRFYDVEMALWPEVRATGELSGLFSSPNAAAYWTTQFDAAYAKQVDTWDYQWTFACVVNRGLTVLPNVNLVSNIGFGPEATHTRNGSRWANMPASRMDFPLQHPPYMMRHDQADRFTEDLSFRSPTLAQTARQRMRRLWSMLALGKKA